ncbi:hypothetical protein RIF29_40577 [Crotalaria pallida]|uniref:Uncharacterized protein n=1 Tax=Crotalaria pallida TaxID=3830 RepID=A0AAN9E3D3_CROPI
MTGMEEEAKFLVSTTGLQRKKKKKLRCCSWRFCEEKYIDLDHAFSDMRSILGPPVDVVVYELRMQLLLTSAAFPFLLKAQGSQDASCSRDSFRETLRMVQNPSTTSTSKPYRSRWNLK